jgi:hypothetical protein
MVNYFIIVLLLVLIYLCVYKQARAKDEYSRTLNRLGSEEELIADNEGDKIKKCEQKCKPVKSLADQLFEQKKLYEELKLKYEDNTPAYRYSTTDRYIIDTGVEPVADDKLASKMKDTGGRAQEAADSRSLYGKNSLIPFIEEELNEHANSYGWWDDSENLEEVF